MYTETRQSLQTSNRGTLAITSACRVERRPETIRVSLVRYFLMVNIFK